MIVETVGIRELRQEASRVIRYVEESGSEVEVTIQGRPAAVIIPFRWAGRSRTVSSETLERRLADLQTGDHDWAEEVHRLREDDALTDPWREGGAAG